MAAQKAMKQDLAAGLFPLSFFLGVSPTRYELKMITTQLQHSNILLQWNKARTYVVDMLKCKFRDAAHNNNVKSMLEYFVLT